MVRAKKKHLFLMAILKDEQDPVPALPQGILTRWRSQRLQPGFDPPKKCRVVRPHPLAMPLGTGRQDHSPTVELNTNAREFSPQPALGNPIRGTEEIDTMAQVKSHQN
jgi:hypothetical protein